MLGRLLDGQFDRAILSSRESFADSLFPGKSTLLHVHCTVKVLCENFIELYLAQSQSTVYY